MMVDAVAGEGVDWARMGTAGVKSKRKRARWWADFMGVVIIVIIAEIVVVVVMEKNLTFRNSSWYYIWIRCC
jgi:uncharacterized protein (DUF983 family)